MIYNEEKLLRRKRQKDNIIQRESSNKKKNKVRKVSIPIDEEYIKEFLAVKSKEEEVINLIDSDDDLNDKFNNTKELPNLYDYLKLLGKTENECKIIINKTNGKSGLFKKELSEKLNILHKECKDDYLYLAILYKNLYNFKLENKRSTDLESNTYVLKENYDPKLGKIIKAIPNIKKDYNKLKNLITQENFGFLKNFITKGSGKVKIYENIDLSLVLYYKDNQIRYEKIYKR